MLINGIDCPYDIKTINFETKEDQQKIQNQIQERISIDLQSQTQSQTQNQIPTPPQSIA